MPPHLHIKRYVRSLQRKAGRVWGWTGEDLLGVLEKPGYSRSATEHRPARDRCGRVQMNVDIVGSRRNGPQLVIICYTSNNMLLSLIWSKDEMMTGSVCGCVGSPWRVAVQGASKVAVTGSGIRQVLVGRSANVDVTGCKTPATVTVLCEMTLSLSICLFALFWFCYYLHLTDVNVAISFSN